MSARKLSCPCGFKGGTKNIRAHRVNCERWLSALRQQIAPVGNGVDTARAIAGAMAGNVAPSSQDGKQPNDQAERCRHSVQRMVRQRRYYPRSLTFQEWAHSAMFTVASPDKRSEFRKIRELIREGKLPLT